MALSRALATAALVRCIAMLLGGRKEGEDFERGDGRRVEEVLHIQPERVGARRILLRRSQYQCVLEDMGAQGNEAREDLEYTQQAGDGTKRRECLAFGQSHAPCTDGCGIYGRGITTGDARTAGQGPGHGAYRLQAAGGRRGKDAVGVQTANRGKLEGGCFRRPPGRGW